MDMELKIEPDSIKGFIDEKEGEALYEYALQYSKKGNCLEIGSYCGKSALYIGSAVKKILDYFIRLTIIKDLKNNNLVKNIMTLI